MKMSFIAVPFGKKCLQIFCGYIADNYDFHYMFTALKFDDIFEVTVLVYSYLHFVLVLVGRKS